MIDRALREILLATQKIASASKTQVYLVGGFPRDLLLNRATGDIDCAVNKNPKSLAISLSKKFKGPVITLAEEEEVFRVFFKNGTHIDIGKFKAKTIEKDLAARDFSITSMALSLNDALEIKNQKDLASKLLDPFGGVKDLAKKKVKQTSAKTFTEDPLRMLRAFRIAAQLGFEVEPSTLKTIRNHAKRINAMAAERIREEILLLLDNANSYEYFKKLDESGLVSQIFPEADANRNCATGYYPGKGVWGHSLDGLKNLEWIFKSLEGEFGNDHDQVSELIYQKDKDTEGHPRATLMKLGILFHDIGKAPTAKNLDGRLRFFQHEYVGAKMTRKIAERLKFSTNATKNISGLVLAHMRPGGLAHAPLLTERAKYRFFRDLGISAIPMLIVAMADRYTYLSEAERGKETDLHERVSKEIIRWHYQKERERPAARPKLIDGNILMKELKLKPGPKIGQILKELDEAIGAGEIKTREEAIAAAKKFVR